MLFIDEIHRLAPVVEEILYPAMEDCKIDLVIGQGPAARSVRLDLQPFTLVGATTRAGLLTSPLRDRFGIVSRLNFYTVDELCRILRRSARLLDVPCHDEGLSEIARRSRGTPRIANRLLRRVRDFAQIEGGDVTREAADRALRRLEVDEAGFDTMDRRLLLLLIEKYGGGPVGVETLAAALSEEKDTIEDVYEPYLLQQGFLQRTPRGTRGDGAGVSAFRHSRAGRQSPGAALRRRFRAGAVSVGRLLLHVCCAPCAAYPVPALRALVPLLAGFFFNPNIQPDDEHARRLDALERYAPALRLDLVIAPGPGADAWSAAAGRADDRCRRCYELRLRATAREARRGGFDAFSTTLLYSIHQKHELVRAVATEVARAEGVPFFYRDLREGWVEGGRSYRESGLYRQRYCGCLPSKLERDAPGRKAAAVGAAAS